MRKIERQIIEALKNRRAFHHGHSMDAPSRDIVTEGPNSSMLYKLHGSLIFSLSDSAYHFFGIGSCHETRTTKSRINAIASALDLPHVVQRDFIWYWSDGILFGGSRTFQRNQKSQLELF